MNTRNTRLLTIFIILTLSLGLAACTRSASTPPPGNDSTSGAPEAVSGQQATMEAVRSALLTQTAQTSEVIEEPTPEPTAIPATETPVEEQPTDEIEAEETEEPDPTSAPGGSTEYTVQQGDWVSSIANKFGVDAQDIIDLNNLQTPYTLSIGQVLQIPGNTATAVPATASPTQAATSSAGGTEYTVLQGEWVYSIARKFGVDPQAIIDANNLQSPYTLQPGDVLIIP
jgi:LysM repeat protein